jgi:hypothetical protein
MAMVAAASTTAGKLYASVQYTFPPVYAQLQEKQQSQANLNWVAFDLGRIDIRRFRSRELPVIEWKFRKTIDKNAHQTFLLQHY